MYVVLVWAVQTAVCTAHTSTTYNLSDPPRWQEILMREGCANRIDSFGMQELAVSISPNAVLLSTLRSASLHLRVLLLQP